MFADKKEENQLKLYKIKRIKRYQSYFTKKFTAICNADITLASRKCCDNVYLASASFNAMEFLPCDTGAAWFNEEIF